MMDDEIPQELFEPYEGPEEGDFEDRRLELVSKELNQIYSGRLGVTVVDLCYFALFEDFSLQKW